MKRTFAFDPANPRRESVLEFMCEVIRTAGQKLEIKVSDPTRSGEQSAKFHAICGEIAAKREWAGRRLDTEGWKRLLVDAWARVEQRSPGQVVPSLDGQSVVTLGIQTRSMPKSDMRDLIEFAQAWAAENDVELMQ
jgi:hypothetical protein